MSDLRDALERKRSEVRPAPGAFERLQVRRRRKDFRRRVTAGTIAASVIVVGTVTTIRLSRLGPTAVQPAGPPVIARTLLLERSPAVMAAGLGALWIAEEPAVSLEGTEFRADERLLRLDPETGSVRSAFPLAVSAAGSSIQVGEGAVWLGGLGTVSRVDPESGSQLDAFGFGENTTSLALARGEPEDSPLRGVWVATPVDDALHHITAATGSVETIEAVGDRPLGVAAGEGAVWVVLAGGDAVVRFDAARGEVVSTIGLANPTGPIAVANGSVWVSFEKGVARIDPAENRVLATVRLTSAPHTLAPGAGEIWAATDAGISVIDADTNVASRILDVTGVRGLAATQAGMWAATQQELLLLQSSTPVPG